MNLPPADQELARTVLTKLQYQALDMHTKGYGYRTISITHNISISTARDRVRAAKHTLQKAITERDQKTT